MVCDIVVVMGVYVGSWFYYFKIKQDILQVVIEYGLIVVLVDIEVIDIDYLLLCEVMCQLVCVYFYMIFVFYQDFILVMLYEWCLFDVQVQECIIVFKDWYEDIWMCVIECLCVFGEWAYLMFVDWLLMFGVLNWMVQWYQVGVGISIDVLVDQVVLFILCMLFQLVVQCFLVGFVFEQCLIGVVQYMFLDFVCCCYGQFVDYGDVFGYFKVVEMCLIMCLQCGCIGVCIGFEVDECGYGFYLVCVW